MSDHDQNHEGPPEATRPPAGAGAGHGVPAWVARSLEIIDDSLFVLDRDWRFAYLNPRALYDAREPAEALLGRSVWEKYPELLGTPLEGHYRRAMAEQTPAHFEMTGRLSGRWLEVHAYPCPDGLVVYVRDASARKRAEEALRESEDRLRRFFDATFEGIILHADGVVLDVNRAAADMFGYAPEEMVGLSILDLGAPESREEVRRRVLAGDEAPYEAVGLRKDGSTFPGELRGKATAYRGRPARVTAVRDVTARRRAEAELREHAQRLQLLSRRLLEVQEEERRRLARELHDEVAQVLVGLDYGLELARRADGPQRDASLAGLQALVKELAREVRDTSLLLRPSMLDDLGLGPALDWLCRRFAEQAGLPVELDRAGLTGRLPAEVETAAYRIVQEALTNAVRHGRADRASVRVGLAGGVLSLRVEDRGAGFDAAGTAPGGGLAGMAERVALLGGRLAVESAPGAGTRIAVELPAAGAGRGEPWP